MNGHHTGVYIRSNLDLVLSVGCLHLVRRVDIDFGLWTNLLRELDSTVRWVRATREQWDSVRTLRHWRGDHSWTGFSADGDESQDIWFPNLRVLELCCYWGTTARWTEHHQGSISPDAAAAAKRMLDNAPLTRLKVLPTINMATMMEFIQCLPRLSSLYIRDMDAHQIQPGLVVVPEPGADWLVKPISSSLKYICIKFNCFVQLPEPAVTALRYLLLVVSSLSAVSVYGIPGDPIDDFVDAYADQYPHLARLRGLAVPMVYDEVYDRVLGKAVLRLRDARGQWDTVRTLHILMGERLDRDMEFDEIVCEAHEAAAALTATFPGVQQLILSSRGDHSWAGFSVDGDESQDIWFPSLQVLDLSTYWEAAADGTDGTEPRGRLHFPALKVLKVECGNGIPHVLERGVFPARMDLVVVLATLSALLDILNMVVPNARHFRLILRCDVDYDPAEDVAIGHVLDRAHDCDEVELKIDGRYLRAQPESLASAVLTRLDVSMDTDLNTVVALIRCLPRLSSLDVRDLMAYSIPPGISIPEPGADRLVEPISSTLKHARVRLRCLSLRRPEPPALTLKYLLLAVPSLSIIKVYGIQGDPIGGFVNSYVDQYPHLGGVSISVSMLRDW
ncbi:hypothetical protein H4R18_000564 [Coemansia javaensis]|uniref:Uncharacterized protein n=1 Tax=Coemansia javaensis TaxID=2761396 RepID=A0A9W8HHU4_9FUNG|nr:hypothetical protein H4R18_000564 [Coemansia javaensis]